MFLKVLGKKRSPSDNDFLFSGSLISYSVGFSDCLVCFIFIPANIYFTFRVSKDDKKHLWYLFYNLFFICLKKFSWHFILSSLTPDYYSVKFDERKESQFLI